MIKKYAIFFLTISCLFALIGSWVLTAEKPEVWLSSTLSNFGIGILTSLAIVYCYDHLTAQRNEKLRSEKEINSLKGLTRNLRYHCHALIEAYRSAYPSGEQFEFHKLEDFLSPQYQKIFEHLNLYAPSPANSQGTTPYYAYIENSFKDLDRALSQALIQYGPDLSHEVYIAMQQVLNCDFMKTATSLTGLFLHDQVKAWGPVSSKLATGMDSQINEYCNVLNHLISSVEKVHRTNLSDFGSYTTQNSFFPQGHGRL